MNTAEYLIKKLKELGITDYFGLPGDYNFNILKAINDNPDTNWIGCTNELNAGYAADGYARQKGFGAVVTTYGAGELSAMNAVAGSYAENVPVIHIVGAPSTETLKGKNLYHHNFQEPKPYAFIETSKAVIETAAFLNKDNVKIEIDRIMKVFIRERKPVYIAIPEDIATMKFSDKNTDYDWTSKPDVLERAVKLIVDKINSSKNPVIVADTLIKRFDAKSEFTEFVNKSEIPCTNFLMGTNIINMDSENYTGTYLYKYGNPAAKELLEKTDCLISVGVIYGDINSYGTPLPYKINSHIAIYGTYTYIDGILYKDIKMSDVLREATKKVNSRNFKTENKFNGYDKSSATKDKLSAKYIYPRLQEFFKGEDIIFAETGTIPHGFAPMKLPENCELHSQLLWCSTGWATPAAFGASIANPKARVIIVTGDGAFKMSAMELSSMCKYKSKPVIIILNNNGYTTERFLSGEKDADFNEVSETDFSKFARSFGNDIWSTKVETEDDFDKALRITQIMDKLCCIEAVTDKKDLPAIAEEMFTGIKRAKPSVKAQQDETYTAATDKKDKNKEDQIEAIRKIFEDDKYETNVHTSLKELEE